MFHSICGWKAAALAALLTISPVTLADPTNAIQEDPSALAMTADLLLLRPVLFATTVVGSAVWLVSLPFTAGGGNIMQAADTLVVGPGEATFVRCLGCTQPGYRRSID